jgi:hypothetical protein
VCIYIALIIYFRFAPSHRWELSNEKRNGGKVYFICYAVKHALIVTGFKHIYIYWFSPGTLPLPIKLKYC